MSSTVFAVFYHLIFNDNYYGLHKHAIVEEILVFSSSNIVFVLACNIIDGLH